MCFFLTYLDFHLINVFSLNAIPICDFIVVYIISSSTGLKMKGQSVSTFV